MAEVADIEVKKVDNAIPRVMFDTNTYRFIIDGAVDNHGNTADTYQQIRQMIIDGKIEAFLSETLFTIEAIQKKNRLSFMTAYEPEVSVSISVDEDPAGGTMSFQFIIGPSETQKVNLSETGPLQDYYNRAVALGFKIVRFPRISGITCDTINFDSLYKADDMDAFLAKAFEVSEKIEERGAGEKFIDNVLAPYNDKTNDPSKKFDLLAEDIKKLPANEQRKRIEEVAKAFAEMSDGDSIASSIGLGCCAFCTNDKAKDAGVSSVMSDSNVAWLKEEYGFNKVTPTELLEFLCAK